MADDLTPETTLRYRDLPNLTDEELMEGQGLWAEKVGHGPAYYLEELHRRYQERHSNAILRLTRCIALMTAAVPIATIVNVVLAVVPIN